MDNPAFINDVPRDKKNRSICEGFSSPAWLPKGLVGGIPYTYPSEKYENQLGLLFPIYMAK